MGRYCFQVFLLGACLLAGCKTSPEPVQTGPTQEDAIRIASQLNVNMREEEALKFVSRNGLKFDPNQFRGGDSLGWCVGYRLQDRYNLMLRFRTSKIEKESSFRREGLLFDAFLQKRGKIVRTIPLKGQGSPSSSMQSS